MFNGGKDVRFRPKADVCPSVGGSIERSQACRWVRLYAGLLAGPGDPKIKLFQGAVHHTLCFD